MDYLDSNKNIFEHFEACKIFKCRDDLCFFLDSNITKEIKENNTSREKILNEIVYAGDNSASVPNRYTNFFESM